jgi:predicted ester cyclase
MTLTINEMKDAMVRLYDEANKQNLGIFDELLAENFVSYGGAGFQDLVGAEAFKDLYRNFLITFPDLWFQVDDLIAEGDLCGVRGTLWGTHTSNFMGMAPPTGRKVLWTGMAIFRFNDAGKMDARWQEWDGISVMQQLGVIPAEEGSWVKPPAPVPPRMLTGDYTSPSQNAEIFRHFMEAFWNKGEMEVADQIFDEGATSPSAPQLPTGPAGVKMIGGAFRSAMPDYHIDIVRMITDDDKVMAQFSQSGTQSGELMGIPPSNKKATWGEMGILRFERGKVVESWYEVDMLGLMQQLGVGGDGGGGRG